VKELAQTSSPLHREAFPDAGGVWVSFPESHPHQAGYFTSEMADSSESFANPISAAFRVLEEYRGLLDTALEEQSGLLSDEDRYRVV